TGGSCTEKKSTSQEELLGQPIACVVPPENSGYARPATDGAAGLIQAQYVRGPDVGMPGAMLMSVFVPLNTNALPLTPAVWVAVPAVTPVWLFPVSSVTSPLTAIASSNE